jgi:hypothetical protein
LEIPPPVKVDIARSCNQRKDEYRQWDGE